VWRTIVLSPTFDLATLLMIGANTICVGLEAEFNHARVWTSTPWQWHALNFTFLVFFSGELLVRLLAFRRKRDCMSDTWFRFDGMCVVFTLIDEMVVPVVVWVFMPWMTGKPHGEDASEQIRIFRLIRLLRLLRLMEWWPELLLLKQALLKAFRAVSTSLITILMLIYVFGICVYVAMGHEQHEHSETPFGETPFATLGMSMRGLVIHGLFFDEIGMLVSFLVAIEKYEVLMFFVLFVLLANIFLMNMLIAILCDVISCVQSKATDEKAIALVKRSLLVILNQMDADGDGLVSQDEFVDLVQHPDSQEVLEHLQIDIEHLLDVRQHLLLRPEVPLLDFETVLGGILECRGDCPATHQDVVILMHHNRWAMENALKKHEDQLLDASRWTTSKHP